MKKSIASLAFLAVLAAAPAEAAQVRWEGAYLITDTSGTCDYNPTGSRGLARLRVPVAGSDNGPNSSLSLFENSYTQSFRLPNRRWDNVARVVQTQAIGDGFGPIDNPVTVKIALVPPAPDGRTVFLRGTAQIRGFDYMPNCTVTLNLALNKRLN